MFKSKFGPKSLRQFAISQLNIKELEKDSLFNLNKTLNMLRSRLVDENHNLNYNWLVDELT